MSHESLLQEIGADSWYKEIDKNPCGLHSPQIIHPCSDTLTASNLSPTDLPDAIVEISLEPAPVLDARSDYRAVDSGVLQQQRVATDGEQYDPNNIHHAVRRQTAPMTGNLSSNAGMPRGGARDGRRWTKEEDEALERAWHKHGGRNWRMIAQLLDDRTADECYHRWMRIHHGHKKGLWSTEEDRLLLNLVRSYGVEDWRLISTRFPGRTLKQIQARWNTKLDPAINHTPWRDRADDLRLMALIAEHGHRWTVIAQLMGRTETQVKNRYHKHVKREYPNDVFPCALLYDEVVVSNSNSRHKHSHSDAQQSLPEQPISGRGRMAATARDGSNPTEIISVATSATDSVDGIHQLSEAAATADMRMDMMVADSQQGSSTVDSPCSTSGRDLLSIEQSIDAHFRMTITGSAGRRTGQQPSRSGHTTHSSHHPFVDDATTILDYSAAPQQQSAVVVLNAHRQRNALVVDHQEEKAASHERMSAAARIRLNTMAAPTCTADSSAVHRCQGESPLPSGHRDDALLSEEHFGANRESAKLDDERGSVGTFSPGPNQNVLDYRARQAANALSIVTAAASASRRLFPSTIHGTNPADPAAVLDCPFVTAVAVTSAASNKLTEGQHFGITEAKILEHSRVNNTPHCRTGMPNDAATHSILTVKEEQSAGPLILLSNQELLLPNCKGDSELSFLRDSASCPKSLAGSNQNETDPQDHSSSNSQTVHCTAESLTAQPQDCHATIVSCSDATAAASFSREKFSQPSLHVQQQPASSTPMTGPFQQQLQFQSVERLSRTQYKDANVRARLENHLLHQQQQSFCHNDSCCSYGESNVASTACATARLDNSPIFTDEARAGSGNSNRGHQINFDNTTFDNVIVSSCSSMTSTSEQQPNSAEDAAAARSVRPTSGWHEQLQLFHNENAQQHTHSPHEQQHLQPHKIQYRHMAGFVPRSGGDCAMEIFAGERPEGVGSDTCSTACSSKLSTPIDTQSSIFATTVATSSINRLSPSCATHPRSAAAPCEDDLPAGPSNCQGGSVTQQLQQQQQQQLQQQQQQQQRGLLRTSPSSVRAADSAGQSPSQLTVLPAATPTDSLANFDVCHSTSAAPVEEEEPPVNRAQQLLAFPSQPRRTVAILHDSLTPVSDPTIPRMLGNSSTKTVLASDMANQCCSREQNSQRQTQEPTNEMDFDDDNDVSCLRGTFQSSHRGVSGFPTENMNRSLLSHETAAIRCAATTTPQAVVTQCGQGTRIPRRGVRIKREFERFVELTQPPVVAAACISHESAAIYSKSAASDGGPHHCIQIKMMSQNERSSRAVSAVQQSDPDAAHSSCCALEYNVKRKRPLSTSARTPACNRPDLFACGSDSSPSIAVAVAPPGNEGFAKSNSHQRGYATAGLSVPSWITASSIDRDFVLSSESSCPVQNNFTPLDHGAAGPCTSSFSAHSHFDSPIPSDQSAHSSILMPSCSQPRQHQHCSTAA